MAWNQLWLSDSLKVIASQDKRKLIKLPIHILMYCAYQQFLVGLPCAVTLSVAEEVVKYFKSNLIQSVLEIEVSFISFCSKLFRAIGEGN